MKRPSLTWQPVTPALSFWLDAVRGLAALVVLVGHVRGQLFGDYRPTFVGANGVVTKVFFVLFGMGTQAVMCFFVLSGILLGSHFLARDRFNGAALSNYAISRLTRIWVVAIPALLLSVAGAYLAVFLFGASTWAGGAQCRPGVGDLLANGFFLAKAFFPVICSNGPYWSINNEVFYYALWPALLFAVFCRNRLLAVVCGLFVAVAGIALIAFDPVDYHSTLILFPVWIFGGFVMTLRPVRGPLWLWGAIAVAAILWPNLSRGDAHWLIEAYVIALALGLFLRRAASSVVPAPWLVALARWSADISFSLYLTHVILLNFVRTALEFGLRWRMPFDRFSVTTVSIYAATVLATVAFAYLFYLLFERHTKFVREIVATTVPRWLRYRPHDPIERDAAGKSDP